ncbi:hypothetical protein EDB86DRAFT_738912 [Lactarius hatsudake]|nr:hypothetical protein EDB86DRAFT_738912 [Lactarius hatsudake]
MKEQNDQRLDELHSKIRTLRGVTTDIHDDVERQNLILDDTTNTFGSIASGLTSSCRPNGPFGVPKHRQNFQDRDLRTLVLIRNVAVEDAVLSSVWPVDGRRCNYPAVS